MRIFFHAPVLRGRKNEMWSRDGGSCAMDVPVDGVHRTAKVYGLPLKLDIRNAPRL